MSLIDYEHALRAFERELYELGRRRAAPDAR
jgi:hypothetical protein